MEVTQQSGDTSVCPFSARAHLLTAISLLPLSCLRFVSVKGLLPPNRHLDCDVIVSPVRETSRKPDEVYGLLERLWPGARRLEIFGRQHNTRPGWLTLGNQLAGCRVSDLELKRRIEMRYGAGAAEKEWIGPPAPGAASTSEAAANVGR